VKPNLILERRLRQARRRLFLQEALNRLVIYLAVALGVGIVVILIAPFVPQDAKPIPRLWMLAGLGGLGLIATIIQSIRRAPSLSAAAFAVDRRFHLQERITTALALTPHDAASPAGEALLADASERLAPLAIRSRFPIKLERSALLLPIQLSLLAAAMLFFKPMLERLNAESAKLKPDVAASDRADNSSAVTKNDPPRPIVMPADRPNKSEKLRDLEEELNKLYADANKQNDPAKQEVLAQRMEQIATVQDRLRKFEQQQAEKFQRLQEQMQKLGEMEKGDASKEGPAKGLNDALSKGDLAKAKKEVDELKKKARDKKLDPKDAEKLKEQLQDLQTKLEQLARNEVAQKKLKEMIEKAKKEGRDAESLERELKQMQEETKSLDALKKMADKLGDIKQSLDKNDFDGVDKNLEDLSKQLENLNDSLGDLDDIEEHLQNLKEMRNQLAKKCKGNCEGDCDKEGEGDYATGRGRASGKRPENPDAKTDSEERRQRARFDPKGRKRYGGAVDGPAFTKKSTLELVGEIKQAAQDAPNAIEVQRLPRSAQEMVKEYFENLGGESKKEK